MGTVAPAALIVGFPLALLVLLTLFDWLENWMVRPDERAAAVRDLLDRVEQVEEVERAVAEMLAAVAGPAPQLAGRSGNQNRGAVPAKSGVS